jgi:hypothetical protein
MDPLKPPPPAKNNLPFQPTVGNATSKSIVFSSVPDTLQYSGTGAAAATMLADAIFTFGKASFAILAQSVAATAGTEHAASAINAMQFRAAIHLAEQSWVMPDLRSARFFLRTLIGISRFEMRADRTTARFAH